MSQSGKNSVTAQAVLGVLARAESPLSLPDIAGVLRLRSGADKDRLRDILRGLLEAQKILLKEQGYALADKDPSVVLLQVCDLTVDGDLLAEPLSGALKESLLEGVSEGVALRIEIIPPAKGHPALCVGDRILGRLKRRSAGLYEAAIVRRLGEGDKSIIGTVSFHGATARLKPAEKRAKNDFLIDSGSLSVSGRKARAGDVVRAVVMNPQGAGQGNPARVRIQSILGRADDPRIVSLISMAENGISRTFPEEVLQGESEFSVPPVGGVRVDLRKIPLVTIDGADARDFDDAVFAEVLPEGGYHLIVAIADVAWYVRPGTPLDKEAWRRGNSTYFPDRVAPMLPEFLSNGLCSLVPHEDRACVAVHLWIDDSGALQRYRFVRGVMRSSARLTYEEVESAYLGAHDRLDPEITAQVIVPLYQAYESLSRARQTRGALDLDLPERDILLSEDGRMIGVQPKPRLIAHKVIEEFMILANVAAATALEKHKSPCVYRVHDQPSLMKLTDAALFLKSLKVMLPTGKVPEPSVLNAILHKAADHPHAHLVHEMILRCQSQAVYAVENIGHYGLALERYAHFTSPIRRYADLVLHRLLISALGLGEGGAGKADIARLEETCQHISATERTSMTAERDAKDRFCAGFLATQIGRIFEGRIRGVTRFGLFVALTESGADGFLPIRTLPHDFYEHREDLHALVGRREGRLYRIGASVRVRLTEANALTGSTILALVGQDSADLSGMEPPSSPVRKAGKKPSKPLRHAKKRRKN